MTELKRPETGMNPESIKPKFKEITEFYTQKVADYQYRLKQLNEYADELENEISVLKETPKVEVLLDDTPKPLVVVPKRFADWFEEKMAASFLSVVSAYCFSDDEDIKWVRDNGGLDLLCKMKLYGYMVEKEQMYYLKNKNTGHILYRQPKEAGGNFIEVVATINEKYTWFTQDEIDTMHTGSYEQIAVKVDEV